MTRRIVNVCRTAPFILLLATRAHANPRPLPFTYQHEQLVEGATELEQYVDFTPVHAADSITGDNKTYGLMQFQTEFEHGITDRLELGLYVTYAPSPPSDFRTSAARDRGQRHEAAATLQTR